ncbi:Endoribonuclease L-PSP/chorismate mutase-like protein, partial [Phaeosphaeriaceae sp. PMI808]
ILHVQGRIHGGSDGSLVEGTMTKKAKACVNNIRAILEAASSNKENVLKVGIFMSDFSAFKESFPHHPARSAIGVASLLLGVHLEMEATAIVL